MQFIHKCMVGVGRLRTSALPECGRMRTHEPVSSNSTAAAAALGRVSWACDNVCVCVWAGLREYLHMPYERI